MYIGMKYSTFCWHYEDLMLHSINYNHWGKPKLWYGIPESCRENFERAIKEKCSLLFKKDPNILFDVITMVSPAYLTSQGVKVFKTLQRPGEFVITFPGAYHGGFSTGLNIGEAVNFVTKSWFPYGIKCQ
jgi:histone demethylase JARID1